MADDEATASAASGDGDDPVADMDRVLDKLQILNYERAFCRPNGRDAFTRVQFAVKHGAPGQQWMDAARLMAWLFSLSGVPMPMPDELADPNATAAVITANLKKLNIGSVPQGKLLLGYGSPLLSVIEALADKAIGPRAFPAPTIASEAVAEEAEVEDAMEVVADDGDGGPASMSDDEMAPFAESTAGGGKGASSSAAAADMDDAPLVDPAVWALDVERVAPLLKVTLRADNKDWRTHLEQMVAHRAEIGALMPGTQATLTRLASDITNTLEKIAARESYINQQLAGVIAEHQAASETARSAGEQYRVGSEAVTALNNELREIQDELDALRDEMDAKTGAMADASPVVAIKQALQDLREDIKQLEVRIGVVQSSLWQQRLRERKSTAVLRSIQNRQVSADDSQH